jgi:predicted RNA-binding protein with TRAM domain
MTHFSSIRYILIVVILRSIQTYLSNNNSKCDKCNLTIHPHFIGYHKCGYPNCPICKNPITSSDYWHHIRAHPGHENDSPPPRRETDEKREYGRSYGSGTASRSFNRGSPAPKPVEVGKEYEVDITEISRQGDGIARVQGFVVFIKNGKAGQKVRAKVEQVGNRFATATVVS